MAKSIFASLRPNFKEVYSRGLIVAFSEPVNPKTAAVLASDGIDVAEVTSERLLPEDITEDTVLFCIDQKVKKGVMETFPQTNKNNTFEICEYTGEELEVTDPYGGQLTIYGVCFESMKNVINKLVTILEDKDE